MQDTGKSSLLIWTDRRSSTELNATKKQASNCDDRTPMLMHVMQAR